jgi:hypothetical protein
MQLFPMDPNFQCLIFLRVRSLTMHIENYLFNYYNKKQYNTTSTQLMAIGYSKAIDHKVKLLGYE